MTFEASHNGATAKAPTIIRVRHGSATVVITQNAAGRATAASYGQA
jgi:hypothetical protein